jgi:ATP/maltotriose-dependent transcriptional regulator MalT
MALGGDATADGVDSLWRRRYAELTASPLSTLKPDDLELLAQAAFWLGRPRETIAARARAYTCHRDANAHVRAARVCWQLFHNHFELNETAAASGWLNRAQRHVKEVPDSVERGYVAIAAAMWEGYAGRYDNAIAQAALGYELGQARDDRDLSAWGLALQGGMRVANGDVAEGVALLDEAMVETVSGDLGPFVTGWIYCYLLKTCQALGDVARATEWTDAAVRWCEQQGVDSWYPGLCRLHRCEVSSLRGEWASAEREALRVAEELAPFGDYLIAEGQYIAGEIRLRRGDYAGAEYAFRRSHELGHDPQPGLALLRLAQRDVQGAVNQLRLALVGGSHPPLPRARVLAALVKAELELGDTAAAARSVDELAKLARTSDSQLLWALLAMSHGAVLLAQDDLDQALPLLREAMVICQRLGCPYEAAEARMALGMAARRGGDEETARLEFDTARAAFARLGAHPDGERAAALAEPASRNPYELSDREVDVIRLVAKGLSNREIARALVISEHTVRRHLSNLYRKIGVTSRSAATAFAFEHKLG